MAAFERHISTGATLRTKCGAPHLVRESRTPGSVGEVPGNRHLYPTTVDLQIRQSGHPLQGVQSVRKEHGIGSFTGATGSGANTKPLFSTIARTFSPF